MGTSGHYNGHFDIKQHPVYGVSTLYIGEPVIHFKKRTLQIEDVVNECTIKRAESNLTGNFSFCVVLNSLIAIFQIRKTVVSFAFQLKLICHSYNRIAKLPKTKRSERRVLNLSQHLLHLHTFCKRQKWPKKNVRWDESTNFQTTNQLPNNIRYSFRIFVVLSSET